MKSLPRDEAFRLWRQWWHEMREEWFKVEVLQDYSGEDSGPSLDAWLAGDKEKSVEFMSGEMKEWIELCRKSPAQKRRFRIVREPLTPYTKWEIELYRRVNIPLAGEIVYLVPSEKVEHLDIPDGDVVMFDRNRVARAHYSTNGRLEKMDFYESGVDDIMKFLLLRKEIPKQGKQIVS